MNSFYATIILDKNSIEDLSSSAVHLSREQVLNGNWEMALSDITFPKSWLNIPVEENIGLITYGHRGLTFLNEISNEAGRVLPGNYTVEEFVKAINNAINRYIFNGIDGKKWLADSPGRIVTVAPSIVTENGKAVLIPGVIDNREEFYVKMSDDVCDILGFSNYNLKRIYRNTFARYRLMQETKPYLEEIMESNRVVRATKNIDMDSVKCFFITTDLIEDSIVGSLKKPLLKSVFIPKTDDNIICMKYDNPYYIPLVDNHFRSIPISIYKDLNFSQTHLNEEEKLLNFEYGRITMTLHFRRVKVNVEASDLEPVIDDEIVPVLNQEEHPLTNVKFQPEATLNNS